ncbi:efflux RND transporter periplasmic adaptor subunit [Hymenobacter lapidiphilus]|uniref:HlyD family efflux transporter periplasmic adaptor subunit n=1 Tax=Hymenobacter lapidiphilus TaxID=2608003 RepID=A0A7Y7PR31_9BACT|nr:hypothetical protein [Hymenobacter lapidiphilus]NVO32284.1 hypothetical protein [Hymenobacter lapidiphilus]
MTPALVAAAGVPTSPITDSLLLTSTGLVSAGGAEPLLARTRGRIKRLYFTGGEYVHRGDVLVKLTNYSFVIAPRDGFLGANLVTTGQYLTASTPVTTISRRRTLAVTLLPPTGYPCILRPGDSVRVWVAARPTRVVAGVVGPAADSALEILLGPGAPFRIGERACVGRHSVRQLAAIGAVAARPTGRE